MARKKKPEPFWRAERNCYFVQIGKKQHRLVPDEDEAWRLYHELMARPPEEPQATPSDPAAVQVIDDFLEWVERNREPGTYDAYFRLLQKFAESIPKTLRVSELKPYHVTGVMDAMSATWSNNTKNDFATTVQRAFNWAEGEGRIERSPLAKLRKPGREAGEMSLKPAEYATVMAAVEEPNFRDLLELA